ncbi:2-C-methyl-D-erythritol 4-phosphate cytidylyltransferase [Streptomyces sp. NPDC127106]|uniref:2-C-methyl-D-erythritol 4-phosphate cytidylyltransferase n=1 Tax=Streptomyces sp. NPDC127106 TaxID=3345360 RepID=UPI0036448C57
MVETAPPGPAVSVILPCAGHGTRFGAAYPKELHCLEPGTAVIDRSLEPVLALADRGTAVRVVVVIGPHKTATVRHLHRYRSRLELVFVYQQEDSGRLADAIRAALPLCAGPTLLVLADQVLRGPTAPGSAGELLARLERHDWAVVAAPLDDPVLLRDEGALRVEEGPDGPRVVRAAEKPADPEGFNAAWAAVAVTPERRHLLPALLDRTGPGPLAGAAVVWVEDFGNGTSPGAWS